MLPILCSKLVKSHKRYNITSV